MTNNHQLPDPSSTQNLSGVVAHSQGKTLRSLKLGALPLLDHFMKRLRICELLDRFLPKEDPRRKIAVSTGILLLIKNILVSREPIYGVAQWIQRHHPACLNLTEDQLRHWNDDRFGRCLDQLFLADIPSFTLSLVSHVVREFNVSLDELHNDSTTITFHGAYTDAATEKRIPGLDRLTPAITWGHNKDHRPDLKQLLFILTVSRDGGIPLHFRVESGNTSDDGTHRETWNLLIQITGRRDFLYVADSKLATTENMAFIHQNQGRFLSVLPRTRGEDKKFRESIARDEIQWSPVHSATDEQNNIVDLYSIASPSGFTAEGYRLIWFHSLKKAQLDLQKRLRDIDRAFLELAELRKKLKSPRSRYRERAKIQKALNKILEPSNVGRWIIYEILEVSEETFRQVSPGRPGKDTKFVREVSKRYDLLYRLNAESLESETRFDGIFPLVTNVPSDVTDLDLLLAYKRQAVVEKRFSHLKTDFGVAPVYLENVDRITSLLCVYFLALLTEALIERELRLSMKKAELKSLPLYPEDRGSSRPTTRRVIDLFEDVQRHELLVGSDQPVVFTTELTPLQQQILGLLRIPASYRL